jgi:MFS family permease
LVASLSYTIAIVNRTSLAALGPATQEHFQIDATMLSAFAVIQLVVYAGLQIPVGILLDRYGVTSLILTGALFMFAGQLLMATSGEVWLAIIARVLIGAGDACTFISVMRLLVDWFPARQLPVLSQVTGIIGQSGQLLAVVPLSLAVGALGWMGGFMGLAAVGFLFLILGAVVLRDRPGQGTLVERLTGRLGTLSRKTGAAFGGQPSGDGRELPAITGVVSAIPGAQPSPSESVWASLRALLSLPGVRLAYWMHFTPPFAVNTFLLLWGTPFLMGGAGMSRAEAAGMLSIAVVSAIVAGLLLGPITSRFARHRVTLVVGVISLVALTWLVLLAVPGVPPTWLIVVLMVVVPIGGPTSMIAFEVVRSHVSARRAGLATGLVNTGGFTSSLLVILLIGLLLDLQGAGSPEDYSLGAFKWAFAVQIPFWVGGLVMILIEFPKARRWLISRGRPL